MEVSALEAIFGFVFNNVQYILAVILIFVLLVYYEQHPFIEKRLPFLKRFIPHRKSDPSTSSTGFTTDSLRTTESQRVSEAQHHLENQGMSHLDNKAHDLNDKSYEILHEAMQKSQELLAKSEIDALEQTAQTRLTLDKYEKGLEGELHSFAVNSKTAFEGESAQLEQELKNVNTMFEQYLSKLEVQSQKGVEEVRAQIEASQKSFSKFLTDLSAQSHNLQVSNEEESKKRIDQVFKGIEDKISDYLIQSEQKMMLSIDLELRSARQLIDTYKVQQLSIIDENIVAMLEKTLSLVLSKKLNLRDQMDLVYEALEKAKVEKFIV